MIYKLNRIEMTAAALEWLYGFASLVVRLVFFCIVFSVSNKAVSNIIFYNSCFPQVQKGMLTGSVKTLPICCHFLSLLETACVVGVYQRFSPESPELWPDFTGGVSHSWRSLKTHFKMLLIKKKIVWLSLCLNELSTKWWKLFLTNSPGRKIYHKCVQ